MVLEGLGISGRLVGNVSTYRGTSPTLWCRVMAKNHGGNDFAKCITPFLFLYFGFQKEGFSIFNLNIEFYATKCPYSQFPRAEIVNPD